MSVRITEADKQAARDVGLAVQPDPVPTAHPSTHDLLIEMVRARRELGLSKYGTTLTAFNGRDALADALEEAVDLCVYLVQAREEARVRAEDPMDRLAEAATLERAATWWEDNITEDERDRMLVIICLRREAARLQNLARAALLRGEPGS